jgi:hypothetical protein
MSYMISSLCDIGSGRAPPPDPRGGRTTILDASGVAAAFGPPLDTFWGGPKATAKRVTTQLAAITKGVAAQLAATPFLFSNIYIF